MCHLKKHVRLSIWKNENNILFLAATAGSTAFPSLVGGRAKDWALCRCLAVKSADSGLRLQGSESPALLTCCVTSDKGPLCTMGTVRVLWGGGVGVAL